MVFTTFTYGLFLAVIFSAYWAIRHRVVQNLLLLVASYTFYAWWDYRFCGLMLLTSLTDFFIGGRLGRTQSPSRRKALLLVSCVVDLGLLAFFKYYNFFSDSLSQALSTLGIEHSPWTLKIILPVGISFYTFQSLSYTIDVYRRKLEPILNPLDFLAFVSFFPQLVAGPIERATHLLPQFRRERTFDHAKAVDGCRLILWGVFKKLYLADPLGHVVSAAFLAPAATNGLQLGFASVCFGIQIYCDFSAYSDIAVGTARLLGFDLMRNFAFPYFSQNLVEFWRRWHISLSTWFRDYVYIPLGGNRCSSSRQAFNVVATFTLSGLWHGAAWTFVVWGLLHGIGALVTQRLQRSQPLRPEALPGGPGLIPALPVIRNIILTFALVTIGWIFFRAPSIPEAVTILARIPSAFFSFHAWREFLCSFSDWGWVARITLFALVEWLTRDQPHPLSLSFAPSPVRWATYSVVFWMALTAVELRSSAFIYFQF